MFSLISRTNIFREIKLMITANYIYQLTYPCRSTFTRTGHLWYTCSVLLDTIKRGHLHSSNCIHAMICLTRQKKRIREHKFHWNGLKNAKTVIHSKLLPVLPVDGHRSNAPHWAGTTRQTQTRHEMTHAHFVKEKLRPFHNACVKKMYFYQLSIM